ncbi:MAG TPA: PIG-L family deacetylase [Puia sp.]|nr:PIG-L family deacetylase [Puia sp.]
MNKIVVCCLFAFLTSSGLRAQAPATITSGDIYLRLKKLNVLGTVLYVAAHPDDENSRLIAYMAKGRLYRTAYMSMTRGDGGQNLIGDEQGVELGLIRTQEMMAARRVDGAEQFFSRAYDFGFSKSTAEALKTWDKDKILSDVVWVIRKYQPDVIITRFPPDSRAGHGHHSASAVLAHEAFDAAADPKRFPEQLRLGVKPWQAKRVLWNSFNFGPGANTTSDDQLKIDVGGFNPIVGKSYGELAAISRTNHKSQGAALTPARGQSMEYFTLVAGDAAHSDPMDGVVTTWNRVPGAEHIAPMVDEVIREYSLDAPEKCVPGLVRIYKAIEKLPEGYWRTEKLKEVRELIGECSGLWLEAVARSPYIAQGDSLALTVVLNNRLGAEMVVKDVKIGTPGEWGEAPLAGRPDLDTVLTLRLDADRNYFFTRTMRVAADKAITQPYWLQEPMSAGHFNVADQRLIGDPQGAPAYQALFTIAVDGEDLVFQRPVQYKVTDPVRGELYEPVTVEPPYTATLDPEMLVFPARDAKAFQANLERHSENAGPVSQSFTPVSGVVMAAGPGLDGPGSKEWTARPDGKAEGLKSGDLLIDKPGGKTGKDTARVLLTIAYQHIPRIDYFRPAEEKFVVADIRMAGHRIGYIEGAGDKVAQALQQMGYEVVLLNENNLTSAASLQQFDAIIAGVRAYDVHPWLAGRHAVLMDYVKNGGNFIVQYNRGGLGQMKTTIGPYPFAVANIRVTNENATVNFALPDHQVLRFPNKITEADFSGWIQERGIYFAGQTDTAYKEVLSMRDPGEPEQKGSLIIANYGKGDFVYTGLVFFRELPAGVPGAYRLMANIIALNQKKAF